MLYCVQGKLLPSVVCLLYSLISKCHYVLERSNIFLGWFGFYANCWFFFFSLELTAINTKFNCLDLVLELDFQSWCNDLNPIKLTHQCTTHAACTLVYLLALVSQLVQQLTNLVGLKSKLLITSSTAAPSTSALVLRHCLLWTMKP